MVSGAWPFLVRGLLCLVDSDNERDLRLLNRGSIFGLTKTLLRETIGD